MTVYIGTDSSYSLWHRFSWEPEHRPPTTKLLGDQCALVAQCLSYASHSRLAFVWYLGAFDSRPFPMETLGYLFLLVSKS